MRQLKRNLEKGVDYDAALNDFIDRGGELEAGKTAIATFVKTKNFGKVIALLSAVTLMLIIDLYGSILNPLMPVTAIILESLLGIAILALIYKNVRAGYTVLLFTLAAGIVFSFSMLRPETILPLINIVISIGMMIWTSVIRRKLFPHHKKLVSWKTIFKIGAAIAVAVILLSTIFMMVNEYRSKQNAIKRYQAYINERIAYLDAPAVGDKIHFACEKYKYYESMVVDFNDSAFLLKTPKYHEHERGTAFEFFHGDDNRMRFDLDDAHYRVEWVKKQQLLLAIAKDPTRSEEFVGVPLAEVTATDANCRFGEIKRLK